MGLNGAGKTSLLRILAGEARPTAATSTFGLNVSVGYYAQEHEGIDAGARCSTTCATTAAAPPSRAARPARHVRPHRATRCSRTRARCRAARRRSSRSRSSSPAATTCCCSTSPPTTSTRGRARPSRDARVVAGRDGHREPRRDFVASSTPTGAADARRQPRPLERRPARPGRPRVDGEWGGAVRRPGARRTDCRAERAGAGRSAAEDGDEDLARRHPHRKRDRAADADHRLPGRRACPLDRRPLAGIWTSASASSALARWTPRQ